jgi:hypothetical protein
MDGHASATIVRTMVRAALAAGFVAAVVVAGGAAATPAGTRLPQAPNCALFPAASPWNQRVDTLPVARDSAALVASIGTAETMHADFGSGLWEGSPIGIPYNVVTAKQAKSRVSFEYAGESDKGPYPIPARLKIEGGSDHHILIVDKDSCRLYELGGAERTAGGWHAWAGAIWSLKSTRLRPETWTSADAAGLPILPGLARYDEAAAGAIRHALRFTVERTRRAYVYPARHYASDATDPSLPPMGLRVRLKAGFDTRGFPKQARIVLEALKRYGMILADNGSNWYVSGAPDPRWSNDDLHSLHRVTGASFEVVDTTSLRR